LRSPAQFTPIDTAELGHIPSIICKTPVVARRTRGEANHDDDCFGRRRLWTGMKDISHVTNGRVVLGAGQIVVAAAFLMSGGATFASAPTVVAVFNAIGAGQ
jgi:hypothetical protein